MKYLREILRILSIAGQLKMLRSHYRKIQMLVFPYLERRGIIAMPRVLWGREDQVIVKFRRFSEEVRKAQEFRNLDTSI